MKTINREISEVIESKVTGITFKVEDEEITLCIVSFSDKNKFAASKKIIINKEEIPTELKDLLNSFVDKKIDDETIVDSSISSTKSKKKTKKG